MLLVILNEELTTSRTPPWETAWLLAKVLLLIRVNEPLTAPITPQDRLAVLALK